MPVSSASIALDQFTTFGDLLKYLRRCAGMTQRELSIAVGYSDAQISRLEGNERLPDLATLTARFIPALHAEDQPEVAARLLELAAAVRREDAPAPGLPPYKGLYYFDEADAELFFGRDELTQTLLNHVNNGVETHQRFLAVVGASGSGKSSVVRAGLIPALRWQPSSSGWPVFVITPTAHPLDILATSLQRNTKRGLSLRKYVDDLIYQPETLSKTLKDIAEETGATHALLVIDQFEELFTLCRSETEQAAFIDNLLSAALQPDGSAIIIIVLRADFYAHCARFDLLRQALSKYQEYIGSMTAKELRCAIEEPAQRGHWELEQGLVELLLHDVGADAGQEPEPGALPLLSHALLTTWHRRRGRKLTISGYIASGGIRGAIAETAEAVFQDQLEPEQRVIARQVFLRLTELGDDTTTVDTRRRASFDELTSKPDDREQVHEVLITLADARLITIDQNSAEVAHEALIREWPTLRTWIVENRESLRLHRHLTEAAQEWEALGRDPGGVYRGARLAQALEWSQIHGDDLNFLERSFLEASKALVDQEAGEREAQRQKALEAAQKLAEAERARAEEQVQSNRRLRQRALSLTVAFVIVGVLALVAFVFGQRAVQAENLATSREMAAASVNNLQVDPERSVLLALQALKQADTLEARNALHQALPELHILSTLQAHQDGAVDVTFSPDGSRLASIGEDGTAKIWDAVSGNLLYSLQSENGEYSSNVAFSPDGQQLATAWVTQVIFWDTYTGQKLFTLSSPSVGTTVGYNLAVGQIGFSPDGHSLAVANMDGESKVWDLATQTERFSLPSTGGVNKAIAYSPDGSLLATGGDEGLVRLWAAGSGDQTHELVLGGIIHSVAFSPDGEVLAAGSEDGSLAVWNPKTGEPILNLPRTSGMYDLAFLKDGNLLTAGQDGVARLWDLASGQQLMSFAGHVSTIVGIAGSPDGTRIATSGYDGTVRIWSTAPGYELITISGHAAIVWDVAYDPVGDRFASASVDGNLMLWDAQSGEALLSLSTGHDMEDGFTSLAFSPDGALLAGGCFGGTITLWDSRRGELLKTFEGHSNMVVGMAFSPDGTRLASASWDGTAKIWELSSGRELVTFSGHDKQTLLVGVAFTPDGKRVFTGGDDNYVRLWDAATGHEIRTYSDGQRDIYGVALNPNGTILAVGFQDGMIGIYDVESATEIHSLAGHAGLVLRLAFSSDSAYLASASFDRLAKVWDISSGKELFTLYGNLANVFGVSFSPDGARLVTAGADGSVRTYVLDQEELVMMAQERLTRGLMEDECRQYLHVEKCP